MKRLVSTILPLALLATFAVAGEAAPRPQATPWLGIVISDVPEGGGAQVVAVVPGGPADEAGLRAGDVLLGLQGAEVAGRAQLSDLVHSLRPGESVAVRLRRAGREQSIVLVPRDRSAALLPEDPFAARVPTASANRYLPLKTLLEAGLEAADIPKPLRVHYGATPDAGVLVTRVEPDMAAAAAGLRVGDLLVSLEGKPVDSLEQFDRLLFSKPQGVSVAVGVIRGGKPLRLTMTVPAGAASLPEVEATAHAPSVPDVEVRRLEEEIRALRQRLDELEQRVRELSGPR